MYKEDMNFIKAKVWLEKALQFIPNELLAIYHLAPVYARHNFFSFPNFNLTLASFSLGFPDKAYDMMSRGVAVGSLKLRKISNLVIRNICAANRSTEAVFKRGAFIQTIARYDPRSVADLVESNEMQVRRSIFS